MKQKKGTHELSIHKAERVQKRSFWTKEEDHTSGGSNNDE
jgi:hypothetical protein